MRPSDARRIRLRHCIPAPGRRPLHCRLNPLILTATTSAALPASAADRGRDSPWATANREQPDQANRPPGRQHALPPRSPPLSAGPDAMSPKVRRTTKTSGGACRLLAVQGFQAARPVSMAEAREMRVRHLEAAIEGSDHPQQSVLWPDAAMHDGDGRQRRRHQAGWPPGRADHRGAANRRGRTGAAAAFNGGRAPARWRKSRRKQRNRAGGGADQSRHRCHRSCAPGALAG